MVKFVKFVFVVIVKVDKKDKKSKKDEKFVFVFVFVKVVKVGFFFCCENIYLILIEFIEGCKGEEGEEI